jgi:hypothetical protein
LLRVPWTTLIYKSQKKPQEPLRRRLREIAASASSAGASFWAESVLVGGFRQ